MAQHKAPTEVTIAAHEEKSLLAEFVEKHWMKGALVAVAITGFILFTQYQNQKKAEEVDQSWNLLMGEVEQDRQTGRLVGDSTKLAAVASELKGTDAGPWALFLEAQSLHADAKDTEAVATLARLKEEYPDHPLMTERYKFGESATLITVPEQMTKIFAAEGKWRAEHPGLYENPAPAPGSPRVRIKTSEGDVLVALYSDRAPKLSENFQKLAGEGFYDGTFVHQVAPGLIAVAGDPVSRDGDAEDWGTEGADYTVEKEDTGLSNFGGYLGMVVKPGDEDPNGSLFYLTAGPVHFFNHRNVVFGKVVEGLDIVENLSNAATEAPSTRPLNPIEILGTEIVPGT